MALGTASAIFPFIWSSPIPELHFVSLAFTFPLQHLQAGHSVGSVSCYCFSLETAGGLHCNVSEVVVLLGPEVFKNHPHYKSSCWLVAQ
jgi:hypothetical protein